MDALLQEEWLSVTVQYLNELYKTIADLKHTVVASQQLITELRESNELLASCIEAGKVALKVVNL